MIDTLLQRQAQLKRAVGPQRAQEIEDAPELVADGEKFQKWNAKARNRAVMATLATLVVGSTILAPGMGYKSGKSLLSHKSHFAVVGAIGSYPVFYQVFARLAGWNQ